MNEPSQTETAEWYAIRTQQDFRAEEVLASECDSVFFPKTEMPLPSGKTRRRALIPHVLFIKTTRTNAMELERKGRQASGFVVPFWIYRYPMSMQIQVIPQKSIDLLKLLINDDSAGCRIYNPKEFAVGQRVRVTGGLYQGYEGFVKRIGRDRHVIVEIEGVCMVMLPFIHPDLLEPV